jgi:hypothetical protein
MLRHKALTARKIRLAAARAVERRQLILDLAELNGWDLRAKSYRLEIAKELGGTYSEGLCAKDRKALGISGRLRLRKTPEMPQSAIALELREKLDAAKERAAKNLEHKRKVTRERVAEFRARQKTGELAPQKKTAERRKKLVAITLCGRIDPALQQAKRKRKRAFLTSLEPES